MEKKVDRISLYSKLTKAEDDKCSLFEDILQNYFDEYSSVYGAMNQSGLINQISTIGCTHSVEENFEIIVSFNKKINDIDCVVRELHDYLLNKINKRCSVNINKGDKKNTLLITISKKED